MDNGEAGVWVWCGKQASKHEKKEAVNNAAVNVYHTQPRYHATLRYIVCADLYTADATYVLIAGQCVSSYFTSVL